MTVSNCSVIGVHTIAYAYPNVKIVTAAVDPEVNDKFHIIPGIGEQIVLWTFFRKSSKFSVSSISRRILSTRWQRIVTILMQGMVPHK